MKKHSDKETVNMAFNHLMESLRTNPMKETDVIYYAMPDGYFKQFTIAEFKEYIDKTKEIYGEGKK